MKALNRDPLNVIICGVGGQGNVLLARLVGRALLKKGYSVLVSDTFGASQRGGAVMSQVRVSSHLACGPLMPRGHAHVVVGLEPMETLRVLKDYGNPDTAVICNFCPVSPPEISMGKGRYPPREEMEAAIRDLSRTAWFVEATPIAIALGSAVFLNTIMAGILIGANLLPLDADDLRTELMEHFPPEKVSQNLRALEEGLQA